MNNLSLIILIGKNILLILALVIYLTRKYQHCQKTKCIERIFNKLCKKCQDTKPKKRDGQTEVF